MLQPKKDLLRKKKIKEDKFATTVILAWNKIQENASKIGIGIGGVVAVILIVMLISKMNTSSKHDARQELVQAQGLVISNKQDEALIKFKEIVDTYGGNKVAGVACMRLANLYFSRGELYDAETYFRKYAKKYNDKILKCSAQGGIAACLENRKEFGPAAELYEKTAQQYKDNFLVTELLMSAGRCYETNNQFEKARECYKKIVSDFPKSDFVRDAEANLKMLVAGKS